jgi:transcriptional regulator with XRE-family HTH domain
VAPGNGAPPIGSRLREARRARGLSLAELAQRSGLTKGFLSQVERDLTSLSVGSLLRLCSVLELPIGELFGSGPDPLVRAAERSPIAFGGERVDEFQLTPAGERRVLVIQSEIAPGGGSGDDAYTLDSDAEFVHVLAGVLEMEVDGHRYRLAAGDSLTFDAGASHRWHNPSSVHPARVLWVLAPSFL